MSRGGDFGLDSGLTLTGELASATATNEPVAHCWFYDMALATKGGNLPAGEAVEYQEFLQYKRTAFNGTAPVNVCDPPTTAGTVRVITKVTLANRSTDTEIVLLNTTDGTTIRRLMNQSLATLASLVYTRQAGWQVVGP